MVPTPGRELIEKTELVSEFVVDRRVRYVAAGRDVDVMDLNASWQPDSGVPAVVTPAPILRRQRLER